MNDDVPVIRASSPVPTPPADDVRKALSLVVLRASHEEKPVWDRGLEEIVDAILAAFEVRPRGPVTDAEVTAGYRAFRDNGSGPIGMRAALEAAREVRP